MEISSLLVLVVTYVARYFIYKKMGREGWEGIIPLYNSYVMFEELYGNGWKFLLLLIPLFNIYVACKLFIDLAHKFNQSTGFGVGLIFLNTIFECILAFSNDIQCTDSSYNIDYDAVNPFEVNGTKARKADKEADALLKYKELLDAGAISEEEYEKKKKEILGL